jgi:hypothetical protein
VLPASSGARYVPLTRFLTRAGSRPARVLPEHRAATLAYVFAFGADWCAVERAERDDLGGALSCNLLVLVRGTKNAKRWDEVPLIGSLFGEFADAARAYLAAHGSFPKWGKQRMRDIAAACRRAGVPRVTPRDLRRSHGKALAAAGVAPHLIGRMLRHTDSRMAERTYAVPERADIGKQISAIVA